MNANNRNNDNQSRGKSRRVKTWLFIVAGVMLLLAVIVILIPFFASTSPGTRVVLSMVNDRIEGSLKVDDLSLTWFGPSSAHGVQLLDPAGAEVIRGETVRWSRGAWRAIVDAENFEHIELHNALLNVKLTPAGEVTLAQAVATEPPPEPREPPQLRGQIVIYDSNIRMIRPDGASYDLSQVEGTFDLNTLNDIAGQFQLRSAEGGAVRGTLSIANLFRANQLDFNQADIQSRIETVEEVQLAPLVRFFTDQLAAGRANLLLTATFRNGVGAADLDINIAQFQAQRLDAPDPVEPQPIDLTITGTLQADDESLAGQLDIGGQAGRLQTRFNYPLVGPAWPDNLGSALISGETVELPQFSADAQGDIDFARLARAVPALLQIRPDVLVTDGRLLVRNVAIRGGQEPSAQGIIRLDELAVQRLDQFIQMEPITLEFDALVPRERGLLIRSALLNAPFAQVNASGTPDDMQGSFQADLARLHNWSRQLFDIGGYDLAGSVSGNAALTRRDDNRLAVTLNALAENLRYLEQDRQFDIQSAQLQHAGEILFADDGSLLQYVAAPTQLLLDQALVMNLAGRYNFDLGGFTVSAAVEQADLDQLSQYIRQFAPNANAYGGILQLSMDAARETADDPIFSTGRLTLLNAAVNGQAITRQPISLDWQQLQYQPEGALSGESFNLQSDFATVAAANFLYDFADASFLAGRYDVSSDLEPTLRVVNLLAGQDQPPNLAGRLNFIVNLDAPQPGQLSYDAEGTVDNFRAGVGDTAVRQDRIELAANALLDNNTDTFTLQQARVQSRALTAQASGDIQDYRNRRLLDFTGSYEASWNDLTPIIHELAPGAVDTIAISGRSASDFTISGPARQPNVQPAFRGVDAGTNLAWTTADLFGMSLGRALLQPQLDQGVFMLPMTEIPATVGGILRIGGQIDMTVEPAILRIPGQVVVLDQFAVNPRMGRHILSRINPIFSQVAGMDGNVTLTTNNIVLPLGQALTEGGSGQGRLDMIDLNIRPGGILRVLVELADLSPDRQQAMHVDGVDFIIRDGRIHYDNFILMLSDGMTMRFYGSVGFDDSVDMIVSMPLRSQLLQRLGIRLPFGDLFRPEDISVEIPITGSRESPRLDLSAINVGDILGRIGRPRTPAPPPEPSPTEPPPTDQPPEVQPDEPPARPGPEDLLDWLRRQRQS